MRKILFSLRRRFFDFINKQTLSINKVIIFIERGSIPDNIRQDLLCNKYEDTERHLLLKFLTPAMKVLEIGTGIGFISLLASRIVGDKNVFCYEANSSLEAIIRRNYALNNLHPQLTMKAVKVDGQPVTFFQSENIISSSVFDRARNDQKTLVESVQFQSVLYEVKPDVLIMDIEGAEDRFVHAAIPWGYPSYHR